ncbi:MAG: 5-carboxymethyl-2-hydroxymuconate Delta-isomerase [Anaerolineae bacterium]
MPNLILEYTDNLNFDPTPFFEKLHHTLAAEVESIRYKGLKSRAVKLTEYHMAEGHPDYKMVNITAIIREGRPQAVKEQIAQILIRALREEFGPRRENGEQISLATDMRELLNGIAITDNTWPVEGLSSHN